MVCASLLLHSPVSLPPPLQGDRYLNPSFIIPLLCFWLFSPRVSDKHVWREPFSFVLFWTLCNVLWYLLQLALHLPQASEIHPADIRGFSLFISTAVKFHCLNTLYHILCIQCPVEGRLGHFQLWFFLVLFCYCKQRYKENSSSCLLMHLTALCRCRGGLAGLQGLCVAYFYSIQLHSSCTIFLAAYKLEESLLRGHCWA